MEVISFLGFGEIAAITPLTSSSSVISARLCVIGRGIWILPTLRKVALFVVLLFTKRAYLQVTIAFFGTSKNPFKSLTDSNFNCQSSSVVEQRTHKPLVACSNHASGTIFFSFAKHSKQLCFPLKASPRPTPGEPFFRMQVCKSIDGIESVWSDRMGPVNRRYFP